MMPMLNVIVKYLNNHEKVDFLMKNDDMGLWTYKQSNVTDSWLLLKK